MRDPLKEPKFGDVFGWGLPENPHVWAVYVRPAKNGGWIGLALHTSTPHVNKDDVSYLGLHETDTQGMFHWSVLEEAP